MEPHDLPDDENAELMRDMAERGMDLTVPHDLDFEHCFPGEREARAFCEAVRDTVDEARLRSPEDTGSSWEVTCRVRMIPSYDAVTETELGLAEAALPFRGYPDGWTAHAQPKS